MKVLLINASPKGGRSNSLRLADAFVRGLGEAEVERLGLCSLDIKPCRGCFACWKATPGTCCIHDDMARVIELERENRRLRMEVDVLKQAVLIFARK